MQGRRVTELSPEERAVVERLLGRALADNEFVRVSAEDEEQAKHAAAFERFVDVARRTQAGFAHVPEEELESLIDEACDYVRHNRE